ncbi:MAG: YheC/YheD family protein [Saprospiraceae bacterium]|nr:YheC/YheD family protein [Saprospiraceae bacterium]
MSVVHEGRPPFGMQTYFFEDMVKSMKKWEKNLFFFSPLTWSEGNPMIPGFQFINGVWVQANSTIPNLIYDRAFSSSVKQKHALNAFRNHLAITDKTLLNPFALANLLNDKVKFHSFLQEKSIATIGTYPYSCIKDPLFLDSIHTSQLYIKPTFGSKGKGIYRLDEKSDSLTLYDNLGKPREFSTYDEVLDYLDTIIVDKEGYFVQKAVQTALIDGAPFDIRVLVQNYGDKYEVTGKAVRIGKSASMTSNLNSGGSAMPLSELKDFFEIEYGYKIQRLDEQIEQLVLESTHFLEKEFGAFCEIGFDILISKKTGPLIIEGNAKPSRWVFVKIADYLSSIGKDNQYFLERRKETVSVPVKYGLFLHNNSL